MAEERGYDMDALGLDEAQREAFSALARAEGDEGGESAEGSGGMMPGRVARIDRSSRIVLTPRGERRVEPSVALIKSLSDNEGLPAVGDFVAVRCPDEAEVGSLERVLPRRSAFVRRDPGVATEPQVVAANIDTVFLTHDITAPPPPGRLEREVVLAHESGAEPVVVLTKADTLQDADTPQDADTLQGADTPRGEDVFRGLAGDLPVVTTSVVTGEGVPELARMAGKGRTVAFLGPSGAGKSSLVNALAGEEVCRTGEVRERDGRGRHVTVSRELVVLPGGGMVVDTPGLRAVALWDADAGLALAFPEVERLAAACRFRDCSHADEPGCAVRAAVEAGELPARRLESYRRLRDELGDLGEERAVKERRERSRQGKVARAERRWRGRRG